MPRPARSPLGCPTAARPGYIDRRLTPISARIVTHAGEDFIGRAARHRPESDDTRPRYRPNRRAGSTYQDDLGPALIRTTCRRLRAAASRSSPCEVRAIRLERRISRPRMASGDGRDNSDELPPDRSAAAVRPALLDYSRKVERAPELRSLPRQRAGSMRYPGSSAASRNSSRMIAAVVGRSRSGSSWWTMGHGLQARRTARQARAADENRRIERRSGLVRLHAELHASARRDQPRRGHPARPRRRRHRRRARDRRPGGEAGQDEALDRLFARKTRSRQVSPSRQSTMTSRACGVDDPVFRRPKARYSWRFDLVVAVPRPPAETTSTASAGTRRPRGSSASLRTTATSGLRPETIAGQPEAESPAPP